MTITTQVQPENSELGKKSAYDSIYNPDKLFPISRKKNRAALGVHAENLPFFGFDIWNHYEVSWLNEKGKPVAALAEIIIACDSENLIESKSMKLYFNSFNNSKFKDVQTVEAVIRKDLTERLINASISLKITPMSSVQNETLWSAMDGISLDDLDIECSQYNNDPSYLITENQEIAETVTSNLLKSNCLVTNQPDWCSLQIKYRGNKINHEGLLRYIVSFRNDNEFTEHCVEKIFTQIMHYCQPKELTVYGRSTRRGGIDINAIRSTEKILASSVENNRLCRQ